MDWRLYLAMLMTCVLVVAGGMLLFAARPVDCAVPQNCLVGKMLFYGAWRATD